MLNAFNKTWLRWETWMVYPTESYLRPELFIEIKAKNYNTQIRRTRNLWCRAV